MAPHPRSPSSCLLAGRQGKIVCGGLAEGFGRSTQELSLCSRREVSSEQLETPAFHFASYGIMVRWYRCLLWGTARLSGAALAAGTSVENVLQKDLVRPESVSGLRWQLFWAFPGVLPPAFSLHVPSWVLASCFGIPYRARSSSVA